MGLELFAIEVGAATYSPPRKTCAKCGEPLGFQWREETHQATAAYCSVCQWLLRDVRLGVFLDAVRPNDETIVALGLPLKWDARQDAEPIPMNVLRVEQWPEVDAVPRVNPLVGMWNDDAYLARN